MKRYGNLYDKICDIDNIRLAHKNARRGKTKYSEVKTFDADSERYIAEIHKMLVDKTFVNSEYEVFTRMEGGKLREIHKLPYFPDRVVQHAIMQVLEPIWRSVFIKDTYQSIKGRGVHKAKSRIEYAIRKHKLKYYLKIDIRKFYPSVDNEILKEVVAKKIKCKDTLQLLAVIIDSTKGLPIGNYLSQYLGNLYLSYVDHAMKEVVGCRYYYRYCDDIVVLNNDKQALWEALDYLRSKLEIMNLKVKGNYRVSPVDTGVDYLGFRFFEQYTLLRKSIATRLKRVSRDEAKMGYYGWVKASDSYNMWTKYGR